MDPSLRQRVKFDLPDWLNSLLGPETLPILDIGGKGGHSDYIDFTSANDVNAPIMCGVDKYRRPFVTLRTLNRNDGSISVHTLFQRYTDDESPWCCGTFYHRLLDTCIRATDREFLSRLLKHQPCGDNLFYGDEGAKTTSDGLPIVELV